jgi:hypothetical protein
METQADQRDAGPLVDLGPDRDLFGPEHAERFLETVERTGGGRGDRVARLRDP